MHRLLVGGLCWLLLGAGYAWASGSRVGFKDARAVGRANAFVATADRPSAVYYNPAALVWSSSQAVQADLLALSVRSSYRAPSGQTAELADDFKAVPEFFASHHDRDAAWALGFGAYVPFGLKTDWGENSPLRLFATRSQLTDRAYALTGAWKVADTWSVAVGGVYHRVDVDLQRGVGLAPNDLFRLRADGTVWSWTAALLWRPSPRHSFGLTYQSAYDAGLAGTTDVRPLFQGDPSTGTLAFPAVTILGYSYRPTPEWNIEVNVDYTGWSRLRTLQIAKASGPLPLAFNWQSGYFYELGVTREWRGGGHLSAGYLYTEDSTPNATYTPAVPDANRQYLCVGGGWADGHWAVDVGAKYALPRTRTVAGSPRSLVGTTADGSYRNALLGLAVGCTYRF